MPSLIMPGRALIQHALEFRMITEKEANCCWLTQAEIKQNPDRLVYRYVIRDLRYPHGVLIFQDRVDRIQEQMLLGLEFEEMPYDPNRQS